MDMQTTIDEYAALIEQVEANVPDALVGVVIQQIGKDRRMKAMQEARRMRNGNGRSLGGNGGDELATEKQRAWLKDLNADVKPGLTKAEARRLITELTGRD